MSYLATEILMVSTPISRVIPTKLTRYINIEKVKVSYLSSQIRVVLSVTVHLIGLFPPPFLLLLQLKDIQGTSRALHSQFMDSLNVST